MIGEVELAAPFLQGQDHRHHGVERQDHHHQPDRPHSARSRRAGAGGRQYRHAGDGDGRQLARRRWNVLELSSFQLETICEFRAHIALALNVTQNHLDRHHTFENYAAAKGRLFETQRAGDFAVLNADDPVCVGYAARTAATPQWFSSRARWTPGAQLCARQAGARRQAADDGRRDPDPRPAQCRERAGGRDRGRARRSVARERSPPRCAPSARWSIGWSSCAT